MQATGGVELSGTLTEDLALVDLEPDATVPDYVVTSDLIVPDGITLSVGEDNVLVYFEAEAGLHVSERGDADQLRRRQGGGTRREVLGPCRWMEGDLGRERDDRARRS